MSRPDGCLVTFRRTGILGALLAMALLLSACGFALRGSTPQSALPFKDVYLAFPANSPLGTELRRYLRADTRLNLVSAQTLAEASVEPLSETRSKAVLSLNTQGRVREFSLFYRFSFQVKDNANKLLLPPTEIVLRRDISFNETQAIAKEKEEEMLYRDMQSDLVQQILRRLAAIKPL